MKILVTGASGFVGQHLVPWLSSSGHQVICGSRHPTDMRSLADHEWRTTDFDSTDSLTKALEGQDLVFYLVHHLSDTRGDYVEKEVAQAEHLAEAAAKAGVSRIIYLGGIAPAGVVSHHLQGRLLVGEALRRGKAICLELRASMIIGHGSASFQMVRDLSARLPMMILPRWLQNRTEPVALDDLLTALMAAIELTVEKSAWFDLPGPEAMSGKDILLRTAKMMGRTPPTLEVPVLSPRLSSHWLRFITDLDINMARELVSGLESDVLASRPQFWELSGCPPRLRFEEAVGRALAEEGRGPRSTGLRVRWERWLACRANVCHDFYR